MLIGMMNAGRSWCHLKKLLFLSLVILIGGINIIEHTLVKLMLVMEVEVGLDIWVTLITIITLEER